MAIAILGARSWECGNSMLNTVDASSLVNVTVSATEKHTGARSLLINDHASWARWAIEGTPTDPSVSVWVFLKGSFNSNGTGNDYSNIRFHLTSGEYVDLRWNGAMHTYDAYVNGALFKAGTIAVTVNTWFHVQFYAQIAHAGNIGVKIDGHESINWPGDTLPGVSDAVDYLYIYSGAHTIQQDYIDDLVWGSGGYLGDLRCVDIMPDADTAQDDWTPTGASNAASINEVPPSDASYNEVNTDAQADELDLGDFDGVTYTPVAVTAWARAWMLAATGDSLKVGVVSNAVEVTTTSALSTAAQYYFHTEDENPDGPVPWDDAAIDALLLRYESVIA